MMRIVTSGTAFEFRIAFSHCQFVGFYEFGTISVIFVVELLVVVGWFHGSFIGSILLFAAMINRACST